MGGSHNKMAGSLHNTVYIDATKTCRLSFIEKSLDGEVMLISGVPFRVLFLST